jgi:putative nucleotidyltransferase with HDIG domain
MQNAQTAARPLDSSLDLQFIAAKTGDLPPIPATALKALQMMGNPDVSVRDLQQVISEDQALAAKILRIVNSAMYCLSRDVSTVSHAIALLGLETVRSIVMAASVQHLLQSGRIPTKDLGTKLTWDHSWGAALCARFLARRTRYASPEEAFLSGLMHDIGKPVLLGNLQNRYTSIIADVYGGQLTFHEAEMQALGFSHAQVGALLAEKWNFPRQLSEAIGYHHNPLAAPAFKHLACITDFANLVMIRLEIGFERNKDLNLAEQPSAGLLKLSPESIEDLVVEVRSALEQKPDVLRS